MRAHELVAQVGGQHAPGREHRGHARHHHAGDLEHPRDLGDVKPRRAAEREQREASRVGAPPHRDQPDALRHVGIDHAVDAFRRRQQTEAEPRRHAFHRGLRRRRVQAGAPAEEAGRIEQPQDEVGVGDGGRGAAAPVARGPGHRPRALRPDVEDAARVHPGDRAAARAERVDVDARQRDLARPTALSPVRCGSPPSSSAMSVLVPPMSKVMRLPSPSSRARVPAARDAAGRAGEHRARGQAHRVRDGRDPAVRLHDQDVARVAGLAQPRAQAAQVAAEHRAHVGVHHGGAEALVLLDLREHLGGERHVGVGQEPREQLPGLAARGADRGRSAGSRPRPRRLPRRASRRIAASARASSRAASPRCRRSGSARSRRAAARAAPGAPAAACGGCSGRP